MQPDDALWLVTDHDRPHGRRHVERDGKCVIREGGCSRIGHSAAQHLLVRRVKRDERVPASRSEQRFRRPAHHLLPLFPAATASLRMNSGELPRPVCSRNKMISGHRAAARCISACAAPTCAS